MEYSVYDLIKILLKRWYIILGVAIAVAVSAAFVSVRSYNETLENYQVYAQQLELPEGFGTTDAEFMLQYEIVDKEQFADKEVFVQGFLAASEESEEKAMALAEIAYRSYEPGNEKIMAKLAEALAESSVWDSADAIVKEYLEDTSASSVMSVSLTEAGSLVVHVNKLWEGIANTLMTTFINSYRAVCAEKCGLAVTVETISYQYVASEPTYTSEAELAQLVMVEEPSAHGILKTVGMAGILSFALTCIAVLVVVFVKENKPKKEASDV